MLAGQRFGWNPESAVCLLIPNNQGELLGFLARSYTLKERRIYTAVTYFTTRINRAQHQMRIGPCSCAIQVSVQYIDFVETHPSEILPYVYVYPISKTEPN
jgi:hypothetical protein